MMSAIEDLMEFFVNVDFDASEDPPRPGEFDPLIVVLCNCSPGESPHLAETLVTERLAACVNVIRGVTSYYVWQGEFAEDVEHTLLIKTTTRAYEAMKERLLSLHSYDNPEVVALPTGDVARAYRLWVNEQTEAV